MEAEVYKYTDSIEGEEEEKRPYKERSVSPIHRTHQTETGSGLNG